MPRSPSPRRDTSPRRESPRRDSRSPRRDRSRDKSNHRSRSRSRDRDYRSRRRSYSRSPYRSRSRSPRRDDHHRSSHSSRYDDRSRDRDYRRRRSHCRSPRRSPPRRPMNSYNRNDNYRDRDRDRPQKRFTRPLHEEPRSSTRLYIKNLPHSLQASTLQAHFSQFGAVNEAFILKDNRTGQSRGAAFVEFANEEDAIRAVRDSNGSELEGRPMDVEFAIPLQSDARYDDRLYIGGLPTDVTQDQVRERFSPFGHILEVVLSRQDPSQQAVSGFVQYESPQSAAKAKQDLNGMTWPVLNGEERTINVNYARKQSRDGGGRPPRR